MEQPEIITRGLSADREAVKTEAREFLKTWKVEAMQPLEGEGEKTFVEKENIDLANQLIERLFDRLGLDGYQPIDEKQVHFLDQEVFSKHFSDSQADAFVKTTESGVYFNRDKGPELSKDLAALATLVHEFIHLASHQKFYINTETKDVGDYRVGYRVGAENEENSGFRGFNEGAVMVAEIQALHLGFDLLRDKFNLKPEDLNAPIYPYHQNQGLVVGLAKKISKHRQEPLGASLIRLLQKQFTGELMHLRDVEDIYGKGSLRLLARYGSKDGKQEDDLIFEFFNTDNQTRREELKKVLLKGE